MTRALIGYISVESYQIISNVTLNVAAAKLSCLQCLALGVNGLTVRALVHGAAGGEQDAGVGEREAVGSIDGHKRTILCVLTNIPTFILRDNVGDDCQDIFLDHLTRLVLGSTSPIWKP